MAKSIYNVTPQKDLDLQTARKRMTNQEVLNERFLRQNPMIGASKKEEEKQAATELETLLSDFEAQRKIE